MNLRLGIVGSGFGLYGLLPAFHALENCEVVAICGEKTDRLVGYCQSIGLKKIYTDWHAMLEDETFDAVAIAVPPKAQYDIVKTAIEKGLHIFAEKPLALTSTQAKTLLDLATKKHITHTVDFMFPEIDEWQKVKQLLDNQMYGKLEHISLNWDFLSYAIKNNVSSWKTNIAEGGGALSFYFSHSLYYLEYFAGKITDISGKLSYSKERVNGGEVGIDLNLQFNNDISGDVHLHCDNRDLHRHQIVFKCENATISLENYNSVTQNFMLKIQDNQSEEQVIITSTMSTHPQTEDERVAVVKKLAARFILACLTKEQMRPSMKDGLRVQQLIEQIRARCI